MQACPIPRRTLPHEKTVFLRVCLLLAVGAADAQTLYVNCKRPNNNGNGLKPATAKRTIQAAVNIAKAGDTILVYPGNYAPINTNNKKIAIKSVKGASKTKIVPSRVWWGSLALLGKTEESGEGWSDKVKGKNTLLSGFLLDGRDDKDWSCIEGVGVAGGTLKSCFIQRIQPPAYSGWVGSGIGPMYTPLYNTTLKDCTLRNNGDSGIGNCILNRCKLLGNNDFWIAGCRLCNCLVVGNKSRWRPFSSSTFVNCTIVKNLAGQYTGGKPVMAENSKFYNCILLNNYSATWTWKDNQRVYGKAVIHNADTAKVYENTYSHTYTDNRNPKFADAANNNYRLAKESPCIDKGRLSATLKKWIGLLDLRGQKRVKGKAVDMGCYEY